MICWQSTSIGEYGGGVENEEHEDRIPHDFEKGLGVYDGKLDLSLVLVDIDV